MLFQQGKCSDITQSPNSFRHLNKLPLPCKNRTKVSAVSDSDHEIIKILGVPVIRKDGIIMIDDPGDGVMMDYISLSGEHFLLADFTISSVLVVAGMITWSPGKFSLENLE